MASMLWDVEVGQRIPSKCCGDLTAVQVQYFSKVEYIHLFFGLGPWLTLYISLYKSWDVLCKWSQLKEKLGKPWKDLALTFFHNAFACFYVYVYVYDMYM